MKSPSAYFFTPEDAYPAESVRLLVDGEEAFPAMIQAIDSAKRKVGFEIYMFSVDEISVRVRKALERAAARGCEVRLVFDCIGSYPNEIEFFRPLVQAGGEVLEYHPVHEWRHRLNIDHFSRRNHRKLLIVDEEVAIVGGLNVSREYAQSVASGGVHDLAVEIRGSVVPQAWRIFERTWRRKDTGGALLSDRNGSESSTVQFVGSDRYLDRWRLRRTLLYAISQAETSIDIVNPYFLPAPDVISALRRAVKRGVKVRLLVPAKSDVRFVDIAAMVVQHRLARRGVEVYRWPGLIHAKVIFVDGCWYSIGSYNFDYQSLFRNLEVVANIFHAESARRLQKIIDRDVAMSSRFSTESWKQLPWWVRIAARFFYRLRRLL